jgi:hypothetical protein
MQSNPNIQMLAEALTSVMAKASAAGIDFGGELKLFETSFNAAKSKPENKTEKIERYKTAVTMGKRFSKAELLNKINQ